MNILAIETSCDETSVAIVRDGRYVLANVIASQIGLHERYGGVVPELASRQHVLTLIPTLEEAMRRARLDWDAIDAIAVTCGPGLAGALLVGLNAAKALAFAREKPLIAVNHLEAHIHSNWIDPETLRDEAPLLLPDDPPPPARRTRAGAALQALGATPPPGPPDLPARPPAGGRPEYTPPATPPEVRPNLNVHAPTDPTFPLVCLVVSGGHTELIYMSDHGHYSLLGKTVDDAAGEAFDKVARILGLPYPGGPAIQRAALGGDPRAIDLPRNVLRGSYDFSFSGLKTAALRQAQHFSPPLTAEEQVALEEEARRVEAERREAEARARREEEERRLEAERQAAAERAAQEAAERAERAEREAEARRVEAFRREAEEYMRREREEEERRRAAARREAEEQARREAEAHAREEEEARIEAARREAAERAAEERNRRAAEPARRPIESEATRRPLFNLDDDDEDEEIPPAPPSARPRAETPPPAAGRPPIAILGGPRPTAPAPTLSPPTSTPPPGDNERALRPAPPAADEEGNTPTARAPRASGSGLIRVTGLSRDNRPEVDESRPDASGRHFERQPEPEITVRPASETPRVLGKSEQEEIAPPPFLATRHGGTAPTPMRRRNPPGEPEMPAFLRERGAPAAPTPPGSTVPESQEPAPAPRSSPASTGRPAAPAPARPPAEANPPPRRPEPAGEDDRAARPVRPTPPAARPPSPPPAASPPPARPAGTPPNAMPRPTPASDAPPRVTTPPATTVRPAPSGPTTPPVATPRPAPQPPRPAPPSREVRPIPKSVQARPARKDEDEEETDDILDELLEAAARRKRGEAGDEAEADAEDEDLGTDDDPPEPPHSRRPLGLDSTRPPEARVPIIKRDKPPLPVADFAASFQDAAVEILVDKTVSAAAAYQVRTVLLAGGVAANLRLRERLQERLGPDIVLRSPPPILCTDNAAMVAAAAYFRYDAGLQHDWTLDIDPNARYME